MAPRLDRHHRGGPHHRRPGSGRRTSGSSGNGELSELGLSEDEGNELYDAFADCGVDLQQAFIEGIAVSGDLPEDVVDCLDEQFDDDTLRQIMVTTITKGEEALAEDQELTDSLLAALAECPGATGATEQRRATDLP